MIARRQSLESPNLFEEVYSAEMMLMNSGTCTSCFELAPRCFREKLQPPVLSALNEEDDDDASSGKVGRPMFVYCLV